MRILTKKLPRLRNTSSTSGLLMLGPDSFRPQAQRVVDGLRRRLIQYSFTILMA